MKNHDDEVQPNLVRGTPWMKTLKDGKTFSVTYAEASLHVGHGPGDQSLLGGT